MRKSCFPPVVDARTRILILGSLPGEASLAAAQYYAHPQNRFWELLGAALGVDLRALDYRARLSALLERGVGIWDVIAEATRAGSLDAAIRDAASNDLMALVDSLPALAAIAFNGRRAAATGRARLGDHAARHRLIDLPSSSPAFAAMPISTKQARWNEIGKVARGKPTDLPAIGS